MELGRIACPHCAAIRKAEPDSVYLTHALAVREEAAYQ